MGEYAKAGWERSFGTKREETSLVPTPSHFGIKSLRSIMFHASSFGIKSLKCIMFHASRSSGPSRFIARLLGYGCKTTLMECTLPCRVQTALRYTLKIAVGSLGEGER
ncbi:hypothetical protein FCV25MIE_24235 [Fagus crenata]